jgi:hypothetical protein
MSFALSDAEVFVNQQVVALVVDMLQKELVPGIR